ncbi:MAG: hypothetical protein JNL90_17355 [Planctomycetes bacterium]|nr:hypothetical protein [Planctomycetota bacterium]
MSAGRSESGGGSGGAGSASGGAKASGARGVGLDTRARVATALGELERVARELLQAEQAVAPEAKLDAVELPLMLSFHGADSRLAQEFRGAEAEKIVALLRQRVRDALLNAVAFERGHVYCLRCESSRCSHSLPPTAKSVFAGYEETGRPDWVELDKLLHRKNDARIERLYGGQGADRELVALALHRDELYGRLLPGFEEPRWRCYVLGQLVLGWFAPQLGSDGGGARGGPHDDEPHRRDRRHAGPRDTRHAMALTIQLVRTEKQPEGALLGLNLVGKWPDALAARAPAGPLEETLLPALPDALRQLRREIAVFSGRGGDRVPGIGVALERLTNRCHALLRDAARDIEHRRRSDGRRTDHANDRARQGDRPTHKAFEDARAAPDDHLGWDTQEETVVVLGPSGRVHFFALHGKHVSSVVYPGRIIEQRKSQGRWVPLDDDKRARLRGSLDRHQAAQATAAARRAAAPPPSEKPPAP